MPRHGIAYYSVIWSPQSRSCYNSHASLCYLACMTLDKIDRHILEVLQKDARISNQDLADSVGLSPSPCLRRMRLLESSGVIQKYVALLDPNAIGRGFQAIVEVRLDHQTTANVNRFEKE